MDVPLLEYSFYDLLVVFEFSSSMSLQILKIHVTLLFGRVQISKTKLIHKNFPLQAKSFLDLQIPL